VAVAVGLRRRCGSRSAVSRGGCADEPAGGGSERVGDRLHAATRLSGERGGGAAPPRRGTRRAQRAHAPGPPRNERKGTRGGNKGKRVGGWRASAGARRRVGRRCGRGWGVPPRCGLDATAVRVVLHGGVGAAH